MNKWEKEVVIQSWVNVKGTISLPESRDQKRPVVLIITGSGKVDRNAIGCRTI